MIHSYSYFYFFILKKLTLLPLIYEYTKSMSKVIKIKKGLDIKLIGEAEKTIGNTSMPKLFGIRPDDFKNVNPKPVAKPGAKVKAGDVVFYDKNNEKFKFTSPVSGTVKDIVRGERRKILEFVIEADEKIDYKEFSIPTEASKREDIVNTLLESGVWNFIKQRPYGTIANPETTPSSIFISTFDTAPLAPDYDFIIEQNFKQFEKGIEILKQLTEGDVFLGVHKNSSLTTKYNSIQNVKSNAFEGKHPAGNVGIQIHHVKPINKGDIAWTVNPQDVIIIGRLFDQGVFDAKRIIALVGPKVKNPQYYETIYGASIENLIKDNLLDEDNRYISGNVLTGTRISEKGYLGFYDSMITVLKEGDYYEFLGWAMPGFGKMSVSRTFFSWLTPNKEYDLDTNYHGGERAFVMTEEYEKVVPMDILPQHLLKAILVDDIDKMEQLGIYEVIEEDFALCDFVCTSKIETQQILSRGIDLMIKELG